MASDIKKRESLAFIIPLSFWASPFCYNAWTGQFEIVTLATRSLDRRIAPYESRHSDHSKDLRLASDIKKRESLAFIIPLSFWASPFCYNAWTGQFEIVTLAKRSLDRRIAPYESRHSDHYKDLRLASPFIIG